MTGDAASLYNYENLFLQELRYIDTEINQYNKNGIKNETKKNELIQKLDDIEKRIMQDNWDGYYDVRKKFRPLLHGLYMKLNYCAPIRRIHPYEKHLQDMKILHKTMREKILKNVQAKILLIQIWFYITKTFLVFLNFNIF